MRSRDFNRGYDLDLILKLFQKKLTISQGRIAQDLNA